MKPDEITGAIRTSLEESEYSIIPDYDDFGNIYFHKKSHIHKAMFELLEITDDYDKSKVEIQLNDSSSLLGISVGPSIDMEKLKNIMLKSWITTSDRFCGVEINMVLPDTAKKPVLETLNKSTSSDYVYTSQETYFELFLNGTVQLFTVDSYDYDNKTGKITLQRKTDINPRHYGVGQYKLQLAGMEFVCISDIGCTGEVALVELTGTRFNKKIKPVLDKGTDTVILTHYKGGYVGFEINPQDKEKIMDDTYKRWYMLVENTKEDNDE